MPKQRSGASAFLALFATLLVAGGVIAVAYVASPKSVPMETTENLSESSENTAVPGFIFVDDTGARLITPEKTVSLRWPDDLKALGQAASTLQGIFTDSGATAHLLPEFVLGMTASDGLRSPDGRRTVHQAPAREDGTGTALVRYGNDAQSLVLRLTDGSGVVDAAPVGWWDAETLAISGRHGDVRSLYAVSLSGDVRDIVILPEFYDRLHIATSTAWYIESQPGPGLESPPLPPSRLTRVHMDGRTSSVAEFTDQVITWFIIDEHGSTAAIETDDGEAFVITRDGRRRDIGQGRPLALFSDGRIILKTPDGLSLVLPDGTKRRLDITTQGRSAIFMAPAVMIDEIGESG